MTFSLNDYFPDLDGDLTKVTWAHAVNSKDKLNETLHNDSIMMIEADVVLGTLIGDDSTLIPVMAHPPSKTSDISLATFIDTFVNSGVTKGIKLDFKSREAFSAAESLSEDTRILYFPLWLNADIIPGPVDSKSTPVDANFFLSTCVTKFPESLISVGWTTRYGNDIQGSYTPEMISNMTEALNRNIVLGPVTFPVRAGLAVHSYDVLSSLVGSSVPGTTLTIWSSPNDIVDVDLLRKLIDGIGRDKIYLDLPKDMLESLKSSSNQLIGKCALLASSMLFLFGSYKSQLPN